MTRNIKAVALLLLLLSLLLFLVGFRLGRHVEYLDKTYVPPQPSPTAVSATDKPFGVVTYTHKVCGISFLYPNNLDEKIVSSQEAKLVKDKDSVRVFCDKRLIDQLKKERQESSPSATIAVQNQRLPLYEIDNTFSIIIVNPQKKTSVLVESTNNLSKLIFSTLEFTKE